MAYVITATGVLIEFPTANVVRWISEPNHYASLYCGNPDHGGRFIAKVERGSVFSFERPRVLLQAPEANKRSLEQSLEIVAACIDSIESNWANRRRLKAIKQKLSKYDSRSGHFKK